MLDIIEHDKCYKSVKMTDASYEVFYNDYSYENYFDFKMIIYDHKNTKRNRYYSHICWQKGYNPDDISSNIPHDISLYINRCLCNLNLFCDFPSAYDVAAHFYGL